MKKINYYHYPHTTNVGDNLTPAILHAFKKDIEFTRVKEDEAGKLIVVGSIMRVIKPGDTILGAGVMRETDEFPQAKECKFLAVRGKLSRDILLKSGADVPEVYGDPGLLMSLIYRPTVAITHEVGIIPHFIDASYCGIETQERLADGKSFKYIDICQDYESFIKEMLSCKSIISSSLHGLVLAEAYSLPAEWVVLSSKVIGNGFKFRDYLTGTDRAPMKQGKFPPMTRQKLAQIQERLLDVLDKI